MTKKKQTDLFETTTTEQPMQPTKETKKKAKKDMTPDQKKVLVERLKAGRERKRLEREGVETVVEEKPSPQPERPTTHFIPNPEPSQTPKTDNEKDELKKQISELRNEIKQTKEKAELDTMKQELKDLRESMSNMNKKKSNDIVNSQNVKTLAETTVPKSSTTSTRVVTEPPRAIPSVPLILKKRFK